MVPDRARAALGGTWTLRGAVWLRDGAGVTGDSTGAPPVDAAAAAAVAARLPAALFRPVREGGDGVAAWVQELLRCPALAAAAGRGDGGLAQLDSLCNRR